MASRKHNQARNRATRRAGHEEQDFEQKQRVMKILEEFGCENIRHNQFLAIDNPEYTSWYSSAALTELEVRNAYKIRRPDVLCTYKNKAYIIEIDGPVHKDFDIDNDYDYLRIAYCKLNIAYLEREGITWKDWIKMDMKRRGWFSW